jgi:hypothetical protein
MPDRQTQPGRSDSDYLRQKAYQQEAEALREDLANYFATSRAVEDLRAKLGVMVEQALRKVVNEALQDPDIQDTIKRELSAAVIAGLRQEIGKSQNAILSSVKGQLLPLWQKEVKAVLKQGLRQSGEPEIRRSDQDHEESSVGPLAPQDPALQDPGSPSQAPTQLERRTAQKRYDRPDVITPKTRPRWLVPTLAAAVVVLLVIGAFLIGGLVQRRPEPRRDDITPTPIPKEPSEPDRLADTFTKSMRIADAPLDAEDPLLGSLKERPYAEQYRCWFDEQARQQLDYLVGSRNENARTFKSTLQDAFGECVQQEYRLGVSNLPVFAAQGTAHYLLREQQRKGWTICEGEKEPAGLPDLEKFRSDGEVGPSTYDLLNGFLACKGYPQENIKISAASTVEEYLFVIYAALKELEHG